MKGDRVQSVSEWWQRPFPGGPAVALPGFPRPLHFPGNSSGYAASIDGIDCKAWKRGIARLGRWPWDPNGWDFAYSKNFGLGKAGGNVGDSGVAGCQRQQPELTETGFIGENFYSFMRCARIPEGLPNAGQPALDATAQNMLAEAWQTFKGVDPAPKPTTTLREKALSAAKAQLGYKESPSGSNNTKFGSWYGVNYQPWCAIFCTWCYETQGDSPSFVKGSRYAYVPYVVSDAQNGRYGLSLTSSPIPGDLVCYDWDGDVYDHIGLFEDGGTSSWKAIEGNTSTSNNSNGGQVMRRDRNRNQMHRVSFVRVREP